MKFISIFLIVSCFFNFTKQNEERDYSEEIFDEIIGKNITHYEQINNLQNTTDLTYLMFLYKRSSMKSRIIANYLINISKQLQYLAEILLIDCQNFTSFPKINICEENSEKDSFPKMKLLVPNQFKINPYTGGIMPHKEVSFNETIVSENSIYNFITKNIPSFSVQLSDEDFDGFVSDNFMLNKIILFTDKNTTPVMFRGLSCYFYDQAEFAVANKSQSDMIQFFNITKFPTIVALRTFDKDIHLDKTIYYTYDGAINILEIKSFIEKMIYPIKRYLLESKGRLTQNRTLNDIFTPLDQNNLDIFKEINQNKMIALYFDKNYKVSVEAERFARETHGLIRFGYVDCNNWEDIVTETYKLRSFPSFYFLNPSSTSGFDAYNLGMDYDKMLYNLFGDFKTEVKEGKMSDIMNFIHYTENENKIPLVYLYRGDYLNPAIYFISRENIGKRFEIMAIKDPLTKDLKEYNYPPAPALLLFMKNEGKDSDKFKVINYKGELTYPDLYIFFNKILKTKQLLINNNLSKNIDELTNLKVFNDTCYSQNKVCLILFLNGKNSNNNKILKYQLKSFERLNEYSVSKDFVFLWVNATCQDEFANKFEINLEYLPKIVAYFPQTEIFSKFDQNFDRNLISTFMEDFIKWETITTKLKFSEISLKDIKCEEMNEIEHSDLKNNEDINLDSHEKNKSESNNQIDEIIVKDEDDEEEIKIDIEETKFDQIKSDL